MADDDFTKADVEAGGRMVPVSLVSPSGGSMVAGGEGHADYGISPSNMMELRNRLVRSYHRGEESLAARLEADGRNGPEHLIMALVAELTRETDNLLGNELVATRQGALRDASVICYKRAEVIEKAIKAIQAKQQFDSTHGINLNSPSLMIILRYFMAKVKTVMDMLKVDDEFSDTFFRMLADAMEPWKKELQEEFDKADSLSE